MTMLRINFCSTRRKCFADCCSTAAVIDVRIFIAFFFVGASQGQ